MTSVTFYFNPSKRANIPKKRPNKRDKVWLISFISHSTFVSKGQGESLLRCCGSFSFQELGNIFTPTEKEAVIIVLYDKENKVEIVKVRYIFTFYRAHNQLYV